MHPIFILLLVGLVATLAQTVRFYRAGDMQRALFWLVAMLILVLLARAFS